MRWILYAILMLQQVADVVTTELGVRTVAGFFEANPIVAFIAGQPPALWKLIVLKVVVLVFVAWIVRHVGDSRPMQVGMGLAALVYVAIVWNNIGVIG